MNSSQHITTVLGEISPDDLGVTLMHEHVFCTLISEYRGDGWLNDGALAVEELSRFKSAGGQSLVDLTLRGMGRQPQQVQQVSEATGLNIVVGTGVYRHPYLDSEWVDQNSVDQLARWMVDEIEVGIEGTGIRAGIIGEIGCDAFLTAHEERVFRAAARAHLRTGVTISTHAARWPVGHVQLDLLEEEGVSPCRVIIGHCDSVSDAGWMSSDDVIDYHESLIRRGAFVSFDHFGTAASSFDDVRALEYVVALIDKGLTRHILLSQDVCFQSSLRARGGNGYDFLLTRIVPQLRKQGVSDETVSTILITNPRQALTGDIQ